MKNSEESTDKAIIYDSVNLNFSLEIFLWEFFVNVFFPLTACFKPVPHSHDFWNLNVPLTAVRCMDIFNFI